MFIRLITLLVLVFMMTGCGGYQAANQSDTGNVAPIAFPDLTGEDEASLPDFDDIDPFPSAGSIFTVLTDLHPSLEAAYVDVQMELDIGTVIGTHGSLDSHQGGDITLHFEDASGNTYIRQFTSGGNILADVENNFWYRNDNGDLVWRGMFEGPQGAIVVVVDGVYSDGDGGDPSDVMSGSVWFRPWQTVSDAGVSNQPCRVDSSGRVDCKNPSGPIARCWKVSLGPYDCRANVSDDGLTVTNDNSPNNPYNDTAYVKLAEFIDLSRDNTFKETY